jgi:quercetin dioxygenase-like cupin family protein
MANDHFSGFDSDGVVYCGDTVIKTADIPWVDHASFEGVALKHLLAAEHTAGQYSYHLVRVAPNQSIGSHTHDTQLETHEVVSGSGTGICAGQRMNYQPGVLAVMPVGIAHEVHAGAEGIYLFAKFIPALC